MIQVRVYDESNKRIDYKSFNLKTEYTGNPACEPPLHYFPIGSGACTCKKYDGRYDPTPPKAVATAAPKIIVPAKDKK